MGSCCDGRAGALVWVRRPNGSWWPGLVMASEELPERRKGTPVKLLGREDGSMDWYDLEKSKRIKAFRCGEYDECIEKAKASAVCANKADRTGKYAKRGDAILHALELERAYYANGINKFPCKEQNYMAKRFTKHEKETKELSQSVISIEHDTSTTNLEVVKKQRWRTQSDSEDDTTAGIKRMRDIQDLGIRSKREFDTVEGVKLHVQATSNDVSERETNFSNGFLHQRHANNSSLKRRPQVAQLNEIFKRKDRRRPLAKVLESTARVVVPSSSSQLSSSSKSSVLGVPQNKSSTLDSSESRKTDLSVVLNDSCDGSDNSYEEASDALEDSCYATVDQTFLNSDIKEIRPLTLMDVDDTSCYSLFDVPVFMEEPYTKDISQLVTSNSYCDVVKKQFNHCNKARQSSDKKDIHVPCASPVKQKTTDGTSKCQFKGRKISKCRRILPEYYMMDGSHGNGLLADSDYNTLNESFTSNGDGQMLRCELVSYEMENVNAKQIPEVFDLPYSSEEQEFGSKQLATHFSDFDSDFQNATPHEKQCETNFTSIISNFSVPSQKSTSQQQTKLSVDYHDVKLKDKTSPDSFLYEVIVDVQSSYKVSHVPVVSLISKLNGKAIIGHPISVEAAESCSSDLLANGTNSYSLRRKTKVYKEKNVYKKNVDVQLLQNGYRRRTCKIQQKTKHASEKNLKAQKGYCNNLSKSVRSKRKSSRVMKSELLSKKIRKLSSITEYGKEKEHVVDKLKGSVVACVPLKRVFSRINDALGCSSWPTRCMKC